MLLHGRAANFLNTPRTNALKPVVKTANMYRYTSHWRISQDRIHAKRDLLVYLVKIKCSFEHLMRRVGKNKCNTSQR